MWNGLKYAWANKGALAASAAAGWSGHMLSPWVFSWLGG